MTSSVRAAIWMIGAVFSFSVMAVAGREMADVHDTFEIMLYRSVVGVVIVCACIAWFGTWSELRTEKFGLHLFRNVAHFTGQNLWFFAVTVIPLAQVFALEFTSPIWVLLLSPLLLGERLTNVRVLAAVLGFVGILIVARPTADTVSMGTIAAATAAIFFALTNIMTRKLTRTDGLTPILFYLTTLQLLMGLVAAGMDGHIALPTSQTAHWLFLVGLAGLLAHFCITNALRIAPASVVMPMDFARLPVIAIIGALVYAEALDLWVFIGAALIFVGNYTNIVVESRAERPRVT